MSRRAERAESLAPKKTSTQTPGEVGSPVVPRFLKQTEGDLRGSQVFYSGVWESQLLEVGVLGVQPLLLGSWGPPVPGGVRFECRAAQWGEGSAPSQPAHDSIHIPETRDWSQITENPHFLAEKLWLYSVCSWPGPCEAHREIHCQSTLAVNILGFGVEEGGES